MEQTEKFRGLSRDQIEALVQSDPKLMKDIVPMGTGDILTVGALVIIAWILAAIYIFIIQPGTARGEILYYVLNPIANRHAIDTSSLFVFTVVALVVLAFIGAFAYKRSNLKGRLDAATFATNIELKYDSSRLIDLTIKINDFSLHSWKNAPGLMCSSQIQSLRFAEHASGNMMLFETSLRRSSHHHGSNIESLCMILEKSEKERLIARLGTFTNIPKPAANGIMLP